MVRSPWGTYRASVVTPGSSRSTGVFVIGMHRAGTSATTRALNLLGLPLASEDDLKPASPNNPTGFWEVEHLAEFNDELLLLLGGSTLAPPPLEAGWSERRSLHSARSLGRSAFLRAHRTERWVWKDPRNCVLLPFWRAALEARPLVVLVHRDPIEVARSLQSRSPRQALSRALCLAAWERHMRAAIGNARGLPVHVTRYSQLVSDPARWAEEVSTFLRRHGLDGDTLGGAARILEFVRSRNGEGAAGARPPGQPAASEARGPVVAPAAPEPGGPAPMFEPSPPGPPGPSPAFRPSPPDPAGPSRAFEPSPEQRELVATLESLAGGHDRFAEPSLPPETDWVEPILAERRRAEIDRRQMQRSLRAARRRLRAARAARAA